MTTPSSFLADVNTLLDSIENALVEQSHDKVNTLCQQLQQMLQTHVRVQKQEMLSSAEDRVLTQLIEKRLAVLKTTLVQQGAAADRALATLLPDRALGSYGNKTSSFGQARGPNLKSYQA